MNSVTDAQHNPKATPLDPGLALLLAGATAGLWASYDLRHSLPVWFTLIASLVLYYAIFYGARSTRVRRTVAHVALLLGLAAALYFLVQSRHLIDASKSAALRSMAAFLSGPFPQWDLWRPFPNGVATLLEGLFPLGIALTISSPSTSGRLFHGAATAAIALAILITACRGTWVALLIAGTLWGVTRLSWTSLFSRLFRRDARFCVSAKSCVSTGILRALAVLTIAAAICAYLFIGPGAPNVGSALRQIFFRPDRIAVYRGSLRLIQNFAFTGIGLGEVFALVYSKYVLLIPYSFLTYAHNLYLTVWLGHGLLGIVGLGWVIVAWGALVVRQQRCGNTDPIFQATTCGIATTLIHGLFDARPYVDLWSMWPLYALLGLAVASASPLSRRGRLQGISKWTSALLLIILIGTITLAFPSIRAAAHANLGAVQQAKAELADRAEGIGMRRLESAVAHYERALELDPHNRTAHLRLGNLAVAAGNYAQGKTHLETVWQADPQDPTARKALGLACAWNGESERAANLLRDTHDIVHELNTWGWWYNEQGQPQVARYAYQTSLALDPDQPQIREVLTNTR